MRLPTSYIRVKDSPEGNPTARASGGAGGTLYVVEDADTAGDLTTDLPVTITERSSIYWVFNLHGGITGTADGEVDFQVTLSTRVLGAEVGTKSWINIKVSDGDKGFSAELFEAFTTVDPGDWIFRAFVNGSVTTTIEVVSAVLVMDNCEIDMMDAP